MTTSDSGGRERERERERAEGVSLVASVGFTLWALFVCGACCDAGDISVMLSHCAVWICFSGYLVGR